MENEKFRIEIFCTPIGDRQQASSCPKFDEISRMVSGLTLGVLTVRPDRMILVTEIH